MSEKICKILVEQLDIKYISSVCCFMLFVQYVMRGKQQTANKQKKTYIKQSWVGWVMGNGGWCAVGWEGGEVVGHGRMVVRGGVVVRGRLRECGVNCKVSVYINGSVASGSTSNINLAMFRSAKKHAACLLRS